MSAQLALPTGTHTITVARTASDSGNVNIDSLALVAPWAAPRRWPPTTTTTPAPAAAVTSVSLPTTSSWDSWRTIAIPISLAAGDNDVTLGCPDANSCQLNIDTVAVTRRTAPLLAPHAALGGYRRGLDGVNGTAVTTPGLLYQDGWMLLNDTTSAIFGNATKQVTPRPGHGGQPYQDGYVFGYGHDYRQGLSDLATLTGPSELPPATRTSSCRGSAPRACLRTCW